MLNSLQNDIKSNDVVLYCNNHNTIWVNQGQKKEKNVLLCSWNVFWLNLSMSAYNVLHLTNNKYNPPLLPHPIWMWEYFWDGDKTLHRDVYKKWGGIQNKIKFQNNLKELIHKVLEGGCIQVQHSF